MKRVRSWRSIALGAAGLVAVAVVLAFFAVAARYAFPLQLAELSSRWELWRGQVRTVQSGELSGYVQDACVKGGVNRGRGDDSCTCVALVHGLADNALTWKKILLWPENGWLKPLKLYAFDLQGSGRSAPPAHPKTAYRARNQARALRQALEPLCDKWMVVGNSLGGWIATWLALDWPEGVSKLVLIGSSGLRSTAARQSESGELEAFRNPTVESLKEFQKRAYFKGRELPDSIWRAAVERMRESNARQVLEAQTDEDYLDGRLASLKRPALLVWGEADRMTPLSDGLLLKSQIPGAIWFEVPECGHLPQKECPVDLIRAIGKMSDFGAV